VVFPAKLLNEGEHVVVSTRTHAKALIGPVLVLVVLVLVWVAAAILPSGGLVGAVVIGIVSAVIIAIFCVKPFLTWLTTTYTFTDRRFIKRSGLIAKEGRTIPLNRISGVDFEIGVIDGRCGCSTLIVSDASTDGQVRLHDVPHVDQVQLQVAVELRRLASRDRVVDGT